MVASGVDRIEGGTGNDTLEGNAGADTFLFAVGSAKDSIGDFARGADLIDLTGYANVTGFGDLEIAISGGNSVIDLGLSNGAAAGVDVLTVANVANLNGGDFVFA